MSKYNADRATANSIINRTLSNANGIGSSKSYSRSNSDYKGENGHKISDKVHSIKDAQNLRTVTTQYVNFIKENFEGKVNGNINKESLRAFIIQKSETVQGSTLNTYLSSLNKMQINMEKSNIGKLNSGDIKDVKKEIKEHISLKTEHTNRAYSNSNEILNNMKNTAFAISAELQVNAGLRLNDAINSEKWQINSDNTLKIVGSKGGITYTTAPLSNELIAKVIEAKEENYKINREEYRIAVKEAIEASGEQFNGSHGLRYAFAQNRVENLEKIGLTKIEAEAKTSLEMGHSRVEITGHYLG